MRRWNGWGDKTIDYPLHPSASLYLNQIVGPGLNLPSDISLQDTLDQIQPSRLQGVDSTILDSLNITLDPYERLLHSRGQSLPDWIAIRSGQIGNFPDAVAFPTSDAYVRSILDFAQKTSVTIIPYGGGTSVVGHITPLPSDLPIISVDLSRINEMIELDSTSGLATFGAGIKGPDLEEQLNKFGFTLGHFPQSFELSTLGGWIATRSRGQQSYYYGDIAKSFAGGTIETPSGQLSLPVYPASATGPDLRQCMLGSEGRFGIITKATMRVHPLPEHEAFYGAFFKSWKDGIQALRLIAQEGIQVSMLRLSDPLETETTLKLSGKDRLINLAGHALDFLGYTNERCLLVYGITGNRKTARTAKQQTNHMIRENHGLPTGQIIGNQWVKSRFLTPYLRNTLWEAGFALDTLETAVPWAKIEKTTIAVKKALIEAMESFSERLLVFCHLSHIYTDGASIYTTYLFRRARSPDDTYQRWFELKTAASQTIIAFGGTISHQHGVGIDHKPYLSAENGPLGMKTLSAVKFVFDPRGIMNPGKLFPD